MANVEYHPDLEDPVLVASDGGEFGFPILPEADVIELDTFRQRLQELKSNLRERAIADRDALDKRSAENTKITEIGITVFNAFEVNSEAGDNVIETDPIQIRLQELRANLGERAAANREALAQRSSDNAVAAESSALQYGSLKEIRLRVKSSRFTQEKRTAEFLQNLRTDGFLKYIESTWETATRQPKDEPVVRNVVGREAIVERIKLSRERTKRRLLQKRRTVGFINEIQQARPQDSIVVGLETTDSTHTETDVVVPSNNEDNPITSQNSSASTSESARPQPNRSQKRVNKKLAKAGRKHAKGGSWLRRIANYQFPERKRSGRSRLSSTARKEDRKIQDSLIRWND